MTHISAFNSAGVRPKWSILSTLVVLGVVLLLLADGPRSAVADRVDNYWPVTVQYNITSDAGTEEHTWSARAWTDWTDSVDAIERTDLAVQSSDGGGLFSQGQGSLTTHSPDGREVTVWHPPVPDPQETESIEGFAVETPVVDEEVFEANRTRNPNYYMNRGRGAPETNDATIELATDDLKDVALDLSRRLDLPMGDLAWYSSREVYPCGDGCNSEVVDRVVYHLNTEIPLYVEHTDGGSLQATMRVQSMTFGP